MQTADKTGETAKPNQSSQLSAEARELLIEGSQDANGTILCVSVMEGLIISTNGKTLTQPGNPRIEALGFPVADIADDVLRSFGFVAAAFQSA